MKTAAIIPASIDFSLEHGIPFAPEFGDVYHPRVGALNQARHVFLAGNRLPQRWQGRSQFTILETGFGLGNNFLATWDAWRNDPQRCSRLSFVSIESRPPTVEQLQRVHRDSPVREMAAALITAWPEATPNLHRRVFEGGRIELLLALGDVQSWLPELIVDVDAFFLDGFAPDRNPTMWDARVCKALGRRAATGATAATWTAAHAVRDGLRSAGFEVRLDAGTGGKRDITLARHAPAFVPRRPAGRPGPPAAGNSRRALIIGGGLAGCATAWALAERGWTSTLFERRASMCSEASGNPAAIFHGTVNAFDGLHARFNRAAALAVRPEIQAAVDAHGVPGDAGGLLRLETGLALTQMQALLDRLGLPASYVEAVDAAIASRTSGLPLQSPAWHYPGGGWVNPAGFARSLIERGTNRIDVRCAAAVQRIARVAGRWELFDADDRLLDTAETLVLANAGDALRLLGAPAWGLHAIRGQISLLPVDAVPPALAGCRRPVAGAGYLTPESNGSLMFGATHQVDDSDATVRSTDHVANLRQLQQLSAEATPVDPARLTGRTAWRWTTRDRLPIVGAVPSLACLSGAEPLPPRCDQPRFVPREPGLYVFTGLGSRGVTWSSIGGQTVAALISGTPVPLEADLFDAIDPARFVSRLQRRAAGLASAR